MKNIYRGFSLLEMLIVITLLGILGSFGFSSYSKHMINTRRVEATVTLSKLAATLEQFYVEHNTYENASLATLGFSDKIQNNYHLTLAEATPTHFEIIAEPLDQQAKQDKKCAILILNSKGEKNITGEGNWKDCW